MKLKKITQKEFDSLIINELGIKECPGFTDYSEIEYLLAIKLAKASFGK